MQRALNRTRLLAERPALGRAVKALLFGICLKRGSLSLKVPASPALKCHHVRKNTGRLKDASEGILQPSSMALEAEVSGDGARAALLRGVNI